MTRAYAQTSRTTATEVQEADEGGPGAFKLDYVPKTKLGRLALAARREYVVGGSHLLDRDEIRREVSERQGESPGWHDR